MENIRIVWTDGELIITLEAPRLEVRRAGHDGTPASIERTRMVSLNGVDLGNLEKEVAGALVRMRSDLVCLEGVLEREAQARLGAHTMLLHPRGEEEGGEREAV